MRKSIHDAVAHVADAPGALEASVMRVLMSARKVLSSVDCAERRSAMCTSIFDVGYDDARS